jgi:hypothetical protein
MPENPYCASKSVETNTIKYREKYCKIGHKSHITLKLLLLS